MTGLGPRRRQLAVLHRLLTALSRLRLVRKRLLAVQVMAPSRLWLVRKRLLAVQVMAPSRLRAVAMKVTLRMPLWLILYAPPQVAALLMRRRRFLLTG